jgi:competence protein ComEC
MHIDRLLWSLAAGVALGAAMALPPVVPLIAATPLLAARRRRVAAVVGLFLIGTTAGAVASIRELDTGPVSELASQVPVCRFAGAVREHGGGLGTLVSLERIDCRSVRASGRIGKVVVDGRVGEPGGTLSGEGRLVPLGRDGFSTARRRLGASAQLIPARVSAARPTSPLPRVAAILRNGVSDAGGRLEPRRGALLAGLTIGDTTGMDPRTEENLRRAGLSHLVAVSGSNVAIVVGAIALLVRTLGRIPSFTASACALLLYISVVGPEPSVLRAGTMGAIALIALASGRRAEPLAALALAIVCVLLLRPGMVWSVGLHLSVAATLGLILWSEPIRRALPLPRSFALAAAATLAAQTAVAPVLIGVFGQLSIAGPVANLLAVPAVPAATILGLLAGVVATVNQPASDLLARLAEPAVAWILYVGDTFGGTGWSAVDLPTFLGPVGALLLLPLLRRTAAADDRAPRSLSL